MICGKCNEEFNIEHFIPKQHNGLLVMVDGDCSRGIKLDEQNIIKFIFNRIKNNGYNETVKSIKVYTLEDYSLIKKEEREILVNVGFGGPPGSGGFRTGNWEYTDNGVSKSTWASVPHSATIEEQHEILVDLILRTTK